MEDEPPPPPPAPAPMPVAPSPQVLTRESLAAQLEFAPKFAEMQAAELPKYAQLLTDIERKQAPQLAEHELMMKKVYGSQFLAAALDNLKKADPTGFAIRETLGQKVLADLQLGGQLTPREQQQFEQDIRAGQVKRGVGTGFRESLEEADILGAQRFGREQTRQVAAERFLAGRPPEASFGATGLAAATPGGPNVQPFAMQQYGQFAPSTNMLIGSQMQAYGQQLDFVSQQNMLGNRQFEFGVENTTMNPALQAMAAFGGFVGSIAGGVGTAIACWVAVELYGRKDSRTHRIRTFILKNRTNQGWIGDFARLYILKGIEWARLIHDDNQARKEAAILWDALNQIALEKEPAYG